MGLFSRKPKLEAVCEREIRLNKQAIGEELSKAQKNLYNYRKDESHQEFVQYVQVLADKEVLELASGKELTSDAYAYKRGRIDSLRNLLNCREMLILKETDRQKLKDSKSKTDHEGKRTYFDTRQPNVAGLA